MGVRQGEWKLIIPGGGRKPAKAPKANAQPELYNLADDIGETRNLAQEYPDKVKELTALLQQVRATRHSRPDARPQP